MNDRMPNKRTSGTRTLLYDISEYCGKPGVMDIRFIDFFDDTSYMIMRFVYRGQSDPTTVRYLRKIKDNDEHAKDMSAEYWGIPIDSEKAREILQGAAVG